MRLFDSAIGKTITTKPKRFRALASRCGVFPYLINGALVWQYRPEDEVFNQDSIDSLLDIPITIGHPDNDEELSESHGTIYNSELVINNEGDESGIYTDFLVFTDEARSLSSSGVPTSPMYDTVLVEKQGDFGGQVYDFIQTNIRYSSLGLVSKARQEKTKVYYQISKDSGLLTPENNLLEIPVISENMKTKLSTPLTAPLVPTTQKDEVSHVEENQDTPEVLDTSLIPLETNSEDTPETPDNSNPEGNESLNEPETPRPQTIETENTISPSNVQEKPAIAEFNSDGGINVNKDYLDEAIDVAKRASDMGLLTFNDAIQYSLSSMDTLMRMILLKEGVELDDWDDACAAYKVYCKLRPNNSLSMTNSDSISHQPKPLTPSLPKINHPLHQKPIEKPVTLVLPTIKTFDDLE